MGRKDAESETLIPTNRCGFDDAPIAFPERMSSTQCAATENLSPSIGAINPTAIAFSSKDYGNDATSELSPTLCAMGHSGSHQNGGGQIAFAIQERAVSENRDAGPDGAGFKKDGTSYTLEARQVPQAVAFAQNTRDEVRYVNGDGQIAGALAAEPGMKQQSYVATDQPTVLMERGRDGGSNLEYRQDGTANAILTPNGGRGGLGIGAIQYQWQVRRLSPTECERLQGFPDGFTDITYRGKPAADGPRYKALGNSWAVPCGRWIINRIAKELENMN